MSDTDYAALETQARTKLLAETSPPVSTSLLQGKSQRIVKARMRELLAAPHHLRQPVVSADTAAPRKASLG